MKNLRWLGFVVGIAMGSTNCDGGGGPASGSGGAAAGGRTTGAGGVVAGTGGVVTGAGGVVAGTGGAANVGGSRAADAAIATGGAHDDAAGLGAGGAADAHQADAAGSGGRPASGGADGGAGGVTGTGGVAAVDGGAASGLWSMGYYASWSAQQYPVSEIEWSGLTHIAMAFYLPQANGSLSLAAGDAKLAADLIAAAHKHGVKAIASIGGSDTQTGFQKATASATVATFASNLIALVTSTGYDGIDIDWEPMDKADEPAVIDIANRIRKAVPAALITIPIGEINANLGADLSGFAAIAAAYDQLNIMSYGQAGTWSGWKSWHSSALYHTDSATPSSIDSTVKLYLAANVPAAKLGIGIGFYGLCYGPPVTGPDQSLNGSTLLAGDGAISYAAIMTNYFSSAARKWDDLARVPYLSFATAHAPDGCGYISYDDEQSIAEKGAYAKAKGLGGVIAWELSEAYLAGAAAGQRNPLLKAIAETVLR